MRPAGGSSVFQGNGTENITHYFHTLENSPARISRSSVSYNSDNFLLGYKYLVICSFLGNSPASEF